MKFSRPLLALSCIACLARLATAQTTQPADYLPYGTIVPPEPVRETFIKPRTVQLIDEALRRETDSALRVRLAGDLGLASSTEAAPLLKRLLTDPDPLVRAAAVRSLVATSAAEPESLTPLIKDPSPHVRRAVVLAKREPAILAGITDADASVRAGALSVSVSETTDRAITDQLDKLDPTLQALAVRTLGARGATQSVPAIAKLLQSPSVVTRVAAIEALTTLNAVTPEQVQEQIKHAHPAVRVAAMKAAATLPEARDRAASASAGITDTDLAVRVPAASLLGALGDPASAPVLGNQLASGYEPLHLSARAALVALVKANPDARSAVEAVSGELLSHASPDRRIDGSAVLGQIRSTHALPAHIKLLEDADWQVVHQAAISLGSIGDTSAADPIMQAFARAVADPAPTDPAIAAARYLAAEHLVLGAVALRHTPVLEATKKYPLDKRSPGGVRLAAIYAVGVLATPENANASLRALLGRTRDIEESPAAISEAAKALGNARSRAALPALKKLIEPDASEYAYVAHVAIDRINGTNTPFTQPPVRYEAETAIQATDP